MKLKDLIHDKIVVAKKCSRPQIENRGWHQIDGGINGLAVTGYQYVCSFNTYFEWNDVWYRLEYCYFGFLFEVLEEDKPAKRFDKKLMPKLEF